MQSSAFQPFLVLTKETKALALRPKYFRDAGRVSGKRREPAIVAMSVTLSRRQALKAFGLTVFGYFTLWKHGNVGAAMYDTSVEVEKWVRGDSEKVSVYMPQIRAGYQVLKDLQDTWQEKTEAFDGDVVRRILGTVGVTSPLVNIRKSFLGAWQAVAESGQVDEALINELEELWNDILNSIASVDFQLYSVNFTELTETKENLVRTGKAELDKTVATYEKFLDKLPIV